MKYSIVKNAIKGAKTVGNSAKKSLKSTLRRIAGSPLKQDNGLGNATGTSGDAITGGGGSNLGTKKVF